jgi:NmrA-like family
MNSKDSIISAIKGSHTIFLVTNYWETADPKVEKAQGKSVVDASKEVGVKQIIFSSLLNVTEITGGRLSHVLHFDGKADIEKYIRSSGIPATFVLPGYYMSNYKEMLQKGDDGSYTLAYPVSKEAKFPLFDAAQDMGENFQNHYCRSEALTCLRQVCEARSEEARSVQWQTDPRGSRLLSCHTYYLRVRGGNWENDQL